jgi:hypothetical protein
MSKDSQTPSVLSMDIILITKPDIEIIVIQEYLLYVCIYVINLIVWIYHFCGIYNCNKSQRCSRTGA